jgi:HlyD family secretion protein
MNKRRWITIGVTAIVVVVGFLAYGVFTSAQAQSETSEYQIETLQEGPLMAYVGATGTVRPNQTATLIWETTGQVDEVLVALGDQVSGDQVLATLVQTSLPQTVILAQADLVSSEQALDDLLNAQAPQAQALQAVEDAQQVLDDYMVNYEMQLAQAQLTMSNAQDNLEDSEYHWQVQQQGYRASSETVQGAEANLVLAEKEVEKAQSAYNKYSGRDDDDPAKALALSNLSGAKQQRDSILRELNWYLGEPNSTDQAILDAEVALAQAQYTEAEATLNSLLEGPSEAEIALLEARLVDAEREWENLKDGVDPDDVAAAEARVAAAEATLAQAQITAPFAGTVTNVSVQHGDQAVPNQAAVRLDDLSRLLVDVDVSEVDINQVAIGQDVSLTFDAVLGQEYQGVVVEVAPVGTVQAGVVNFTVTVEIRDANEMVRSGMTSAVSVVVSEIENALLVPNRAVRSIDGQRVVYVLGPDDALQPVKITLGATSDLYSVVIDGGVQAGDRVVLNPPSDISFGPGQSGGDGFGQILGGGN